MQLYRGRVRGTLTVIRRCDVDPSATGKEKDLLINATLDTGEFFLRASDHDDATTAPQVRVALSLIGTDGAQLRKVYDDLSASGPQEDPIRKGILGRHLRRPRGALPGWSWSFHLLRSVWI